MLGTSSAIGYAAFQGNKFALIISLFLLLILGLYFKDNLKQFFKRLRKK